jgi:hypothetical protein
MRRGQAKRAKVGKIKKIQGARERIKLQRPAPYRANEKRDTALKSRVPRDHLLNVEDYRWSSERTL